MAGFKISQQTLQGFEGQVFGLASKLSNELGGKVVSDNAGGFIYKADVATDELLSSGFVRLGNDFGGVVSNKVNFDKAFGDVRGP